MVIKVKLINMDFEKVLRLLIKDFEENNVQYALIGGFAMGALGIMRATMDIDFLVKVNDIKKIEIILSKYNYNCVFQTENVSQFVSDIKLFGELDFLHAFREKSVSMLNRAKKVPVFHEKFNIDVLCPEDIVGLKLQAACNDVSRIHHEFADIEMILDTFRNNLNWDLLAEYFKIFNKNPEFLELESKYRNA